MSRKHLFWLGGGLALASVVSLIVGIILLQKDIASYIASNYREYSRDANGTRYLCSGSPDQVADTLADYQEPEARADNDNNDYLRYSNNIVIVGPDGNQPCSIRVESLGAGYSHGSFIYLGPGFNPGSPSSGSGGSPGGPGGTK
ncbi:DUF4247 domain-containing protein [Mycobacterium montefiorense]|uniref:DUF4247 domain-containing protein n=1 Tax=Mycobacterium montefiorense TaxID=154654 RepID=A0AA37UXT6_9MYCO|nr:DUF4247 domain-containing protein [Mycobacterium montefiorense]GBG38256.1 hypothetical protein MmonteBS_26280 [Mycobacterium montefiorense]GKU37082.1 hypothetical protein NJB14191_44280 [Mycobacterium montefiorense]GKU42450.1 hypothetical protein NJB14192_44330 [Mycobacterium montefiorense]GKU48218.1 hypothetical protein NJB14194_48340 [Mycobacterium montefiorense]GKU53892.1 hypothetical protein NJB14195_51330 [Mycobacterium montefiorense]